MEVARTETTVILMNYLQWETQITDLLGVESQQYSYGDWFRARLRRVVMTPLPSKTYEIWDDITDEDIGDVLIDAAATMQGRMHEPRRPWTNCRPKHF